MSDWRLPPVIHNTWNVPSAVDNSGAVDDILHGRDSSWSGQFSSGLTLARRKGSPSRGARSHPHEFGARLHRWRRSFAGSSLSVREHDGGRVDSRAGVCYTSIPMGIVIASIEKNRRHRRRGPWAPTVLFLSALLAGPALAAKPKPKAKAKTAAPALTGRQVMEEQKRRHKTGKELAHEEMVLIDKGGNKETRALLRYSLDVDKDTTKVLLAFTEPANIRGTSLLTWDHDKRSDDQWIYAPARGRRLTRVAEGSRQSSFMGTDFTYEDLSPESLDDNEYTLLREERAPAPCYVIETRPRSNKSGYSRRILWVRQDIFFTVKVEFYGENDRLLKTQSLSEIRPVRGAVHRAHRSVMRTHQTDHRTEVTVASQDINPAIGEDLFTHPSVLNGRALDGR